jgi:hypothetical protein
MLSSSSFDSAINRSMGWFHEVGSQPSSQCLPATTAEFVKEVRKIGVLFFWFGFVRFVFCLEKTSLSISLPFANLSCHDH